MSKAMVNVGDIRDYDHTVGQITAQDLEYAKDLCDDLHMVQPDANTIQIIAEWFRKVRYEAVMADRTTRGRNEPLTERRGK